VTAPLLGAGLEARGVVITGAAGGIGRPTTAMMAAAGARIMAIDLAQEAVDAVVAGLPGDGHVAVAADLSDVGAHRPLMEAALARLGSLRAVVHLAAVLRRRPDPAAVTEEDWDVQLDHDLKATFFLLRAAAEVMREQGRGGRLIAFGSQSWWSGGLGGSVVYGAAKGGVVSLCRGLARAYGPHGITVNCVAPGHVDTPMLTRGLDREQLDGLIDATPLGRLGRGEDLAGLVAFLASDHASFISGATINVSGGFLMY
jgi:NAD(P)-dependent dehydrogenase (short-subunit alcohol dehydrogenase family)